MLNKISNENDEKYCPFSVGNCLRNEIIYKIDITSKLYAGLEIQNHLEPNFPKIGHSMCHFM